jgi:HK97 gp10 family phage protein
MPRSSRNATLTGDKELARALRKLGGKVERKYTRQAVNVAATPILKDARRKVPEQTGTLKLSLGKRVRTYKRSGTVMALVGPKTNVEAEFKGRVRKPKFYAHLVENGHIASDGSFVPAQPFLRPAFDENVDKSRQIVAKKLAAGVLKEWRKEAPK